MEDQVTYPFLFSITPISVTQQQQQQRTRDDNRKSVLIKLGSKEGKTKQMNTSIELEVGILYSKTLNRFCPIKGIIKVYDINPDGSEIISCVGSFNTEELLNKTDLNKAEHTIIERQIGNYIIKMKIGVRSLSIQQQKQAKPVSPRQPQTKNQPGSMFTKGERVADQIECQETPYIMDDSMEFEKMEEVSYCSDYSEDIKKSEREMIGQQLVEQRRRIRDLEDKLQKLTVKTTMMKKMIQQKNNEIRVFVTNLKNFTAILESDSKGKYYFEIDDKRKMISLKYRPESNYRRDLETFLHFMAATIQEQLPTDGSSKHHQDDDVSAKLMKLMEIEQNENLQLQEQNKKLNQQLQTLKQQLKQKEKEKKKAPVATYLGKDLQQTVLKKNDQILALQSKLRKLLEEKKSLEGMNQYLQEKDTHMESIINSKDSTIENLKRMISDSNCELDSLEEKNNSQQKQLNNLELIVEEMREENANLLQTIEEYRVKFGDLKAAKDKALERQLRDCLRWIDQQNRDQDFSMQENTLSISDTTHNMTSIMKGIDQIENMPLEEISVIRKQVINVLKKLDELIARNSI